MWRTPGRSSARRSRIARQQTDRKDGKEPMMDEQTTHQKVALVTGANKGIGRGAAEQLAALGMTVLVGARDPQRGDEVAATLRAAGGDAHAVTLDVTDLTTVQEAAWRVETRFGRLDVLINNAGISGSGQVSPEN